MSKKGLFGLVGVAAVVTAALLVVVVLAGGSNGAAPAQAPAKGGSVTQALAPASPAQAPAKGGGETQTAALTSPAPAGGPTEGIKVHGSWTVEVRNPDGTLVSRTEFENALVGAYALQAFLARTQTVGKWYVAIEATGGGPQPCLDDVTPVGCGIFEPSSTFTASWAFRNLTISAPQSGADAMKVVLSGTATAQANSNIGRVSTSNSPCAPTVASATSCADNQGYWEFTSTTLASPVSVVTGQQVVVTVKISFS